VQQNTYMIGICNTYLTQHAIKDKQHLSAI